jgi:CxxC motif-containing protein (DUF1111 family)
MATPRFPGMGPVPWRMRALLACGVLSGQVAWAGSGESGKGPNRTLGDVIAEGGEIFARQWIANDPRSHGGDGLGPVYNETSCLACHGQEGPGGAGPVSTNVALLSAPATRGRGDSERVHPFFRNATSLVLHRYGTDPEYASWRLRLFGGDDHSDGLAPSRPPLTLLDAARMGSDAQSVHRQIQEHLAGAASSQKGLDARRRGIRNLNASLTLSERNAPALFGAGLIDGVSERVLRETAEAQPDHVRGRVNRLKDGQVGRFGWKAQTPSLRDFVFAACANELGLEIPGHHQAASPLDAEVREAKGLDLSGDECNALVIYVSFLPAPTAIDPSGLKDPSALGRGRMLFSSVGCATCHRPRLGDVDGIYSDLLLHDMGPGLSDSGNYYGEDDPESPGAPKGSEWRTPPLWAFRDTAPYLHDGRARTLQEAVAFHGGQAAKSAGQFFALSPLEQFQVLSFLRSLVAPGTATSPEGRSALASVRDAERQQLEADLRLGAQIDEAYRSAQRFRRQAEERAAQARRDEAEARLSATRLQAARTLERMGKTKGALDFYREVVRERPDSEQGRMAADRIAALEGRAENGR